MGVGLGGSEMRGQVQTRQWTREEYYKMAETGVFRPDERLELIEGEIIPMPPQASEHFTGVSQVGEVLRAVFGQGWVVRIQGPLDLGQASQPEPDVAVVPGSIRDYREAHPPSAALIVEVSDTRVSFDLGPKAEVYAKAGIPDYWVLNLVERHLVILRDPVPLPDDPRAYGYRTRSVHGLDEVVTPLAAPQATVRVRDLLP